MTKENIFNIPNFLTALRGIGAIVMVYLILAGFSKITILAAFVVFALTDGIDGFIARKFNQKTVFGKYLDPVMDRIFMICVVAALVLKFGFAGNEIAFKILPLILIREIIALPFFVFVKKGDVKVDVKNIGKLATLTQSITVPVILADFKFSIILILITFLVGIASGITYARDSLSGGSQK